MTRLQRLRRIARRQRFSKDCQKCGGTGVLYRGRKNWGCVCRAFDGALWLHRKDANWLLRMAARGLRA
jgi:hypothetical protein